MRLPTPQDFDDVVKLCDNKGFPICDGATDRFKPFSNNFPMQDKSQYVNTKDSNLVSVQWGAFYDVDKYLWH